jgi:hypothetical protein
LQLESRRNELEFRLFALAERRFDDGLCLFESEGRRYGAVLCRFEVEETLGDSESPTEGRVETTDEGRVSLYGLPQRLCGIEVCPGELVGKKNELDLRPYEEEWWQSEASSSPFHANAWHSRFPLCRGEPESDRGTELDGGSGRG